MLVDEFLSSVLRFAKLTSQIRFVLILNNRQSSQLPGVSRVGVFLMLLPNEDAQLSDTIAQLCSSDSMHLECARSSVEVDKLYSGIIWLLRII